MKTKRGLVVWATALGLVMAGVTPAAARKDNNPGEGPQPVEVEACEDAGADATDGTITITVPGGGSIQFECLWSPAEPAAETEGPWYGRVGISTDKALGSLVVGVLDSLPGDICRLNHDGESNGIWQLRKPDGYSFEFFAPLSHEGDSYWDPGNYWDTGNSEGWCERFDDGGGREDLNGDPLHLWVGFGSKPLTTVTITLSVVEEPDQTGA